MFSLMTYEETLDYLYAQLPAFQRVGAAAYRADLLNIEQLCAALGNPQQGFRSIHIGGTNGKGSTAHMLAAILQAAGYRVGLYTSPHLKDFRERIRLNGQVISAAAVVDFVAKTQPLVETLKPSFFELTVAMAFEYFAQQAVDVAVIEVGMGGRLDATNVITPDLSLITNISLDHQQFLGDTLPKIAAEKAGIIKKNIPVVLSQTQAETLPVFEAKAQEAQAPLWRADAAYRVEATSAFDSQGRRCFRVWKNELPYYSELWLGLGGNYQTYNLAGVLQALDCLRSVGYQLSEEALQQGLAEVINLTGLKGRWQILSQKPLTICDTAHNEAGLKEVLNALAQIPRQELHIVLGVVADKDLSQVLPLFPKSARYYFCAPAETMRALPAEQLQAQALNYQLKGDCFAGVNEALKAAQLQAHPEDLVFVGGSTFTVAGLNGL
jgi:dihydrofolate synthase/folylpolyglutamate synthase